MSGAQPAMSSSANNSLQSSAPQVEHCLPIDYLLHLADNALVLGQRNAEWSGHGPILEEDIALSNNSLDLVGQARLLYQEAAAQIGNGATEDTLAFFRDVPDFKNYTLLELPHHAPLAGTSASEPNDKSEFFEPSSDKVYRHPTFYEIPSEVGHM